MAPKPRRVTAMALAALLTRIGSASSGTKATLQDRFLRDIHRSRLFARHPEWEARQTAGGDRKLRIVSIDMGIKNLAFCDAEVHYPSGKNFNAKMEVLKWEKIDLLTTARDSSLREMKKGTPDGEEDVDPYSLPVLSTTAYNLVRSTILAGQPDIILIEKQRWRSGNGSAIQQWTVRVNTLESMLWAILETLRKERKTVLPGLEETDAEGDYEIYSVDPKRVGQYWLGQHAGNLTKKDSTPKTVSDLGRDALQVEGEEDEVKKISRSKAEKKAKIALLRSWLTSTPTSTAGSSDATATPTITFKINASAEPTWKALCSPSKPTRRKKLKSSDETVVSAAAAEIGDSELKKLDDVTDCFLQAAAWVSWESNRLQLQEVRGRMRNEDGSVPELTEEIIQDMVEETTGG